VRQDIHPASFAIIPQRDIKTMSHHRQPVPLSAHPSVPPAFSIESGLFSAPQHDTVHSIFAPLHYERGYSYPLIVWLHGPGGNERQLLRIMPMVSMRNYLAVAPRGTLLPAGPGQEAAYGWQQDDDHVNESEQRIFDSIEAVAQRFHVASRRVFLAGFDCGGTMAFRVALHRPDRFAGVLSLGGAFPAGCSALAKLPEARQLPVFLAAGRRSSQYGEAEVCGDLRLLHTAGVSITLRLYPCGHEISPQMLSDMDRWIIDQITSPGLSVAQTDHQWSREADL
jgi:phospholipase/carboxylesterase